MRNLTEAEMLSLTGLLKLEQDGYIVSKALQTLISDEELKKQGEAAFLEKEGRIKGIQQFITENRLINVQGEVQ